MGLGVGYGAQQALNLNYGRFVDTGSLLQNVANARSDFRSPAYIGLRSAGLSSQYISKHDAGDVSVAFLHAMERRLSGVRPEALGSTAEALKFTSVLSMDDIRRYHNASPEERAKQDQEYQKDKKNLDVVDEVTRKWQDLQTQLSRAGTQIENIFVTGLAKLADPISKLSSAFSDLAKSFFDSSAIKEGLSNLAEGVESFAKYIGTQDFKDNMKAFADGIGDIAHAIVKGLRLLGIVGDAKNPADPTAAITSGAETPLGSTMAQRLANYKRDANPGTRNLANAATARRGAKGATGQAMTVAMDQLRKEGVPEANLRAAAAILVGQATAEFGLDPTKDHDGGTGHGIYGARLDRRDKMFSWLDQNGFDHDSLEGQMRYMAHEAMGGKYELTKRALMGATKDNISDLTPIVTKEFENPRVVNDRSGVTTGAYDIGPTVPGAMPSQSNNYNGLRIGGAYPGEAVAGGKADAGIIDLARYLQNNDKDFDKVNALNDAAHQHGLGSGASGPHAQGLAGDFAYKSKDYEAARQRTRAYLNGLGLKEGSIGRGDGDYAIEGGTRDHMHVQFQSHEAAARYHAMIAKDTKGDDDEASKVGDDEKKSDALARQKEIDKNIKDAAERVPPEKRTLLDFAHGTIDYSGPRHDDARKAEGLNTPKYQTAINDYSFAPRGTSPRADDAGKGISMEQWQTSVAAPSITVHNNSGGSAVTSAAQVPY